MLRSPAPARGDCRGRLSRCLARSATALGVTLLAAVAAQVVNAQSTDTRSSERPNLVLIMADDLGWGDVGFNGNEVIKTPHLEAMARDGLRLTRFYAAAPVCSPTRGSCLTGRHPYRYGVFFANTGHMREQELTLAELLRAHGYVTGHFGKWHLGTLTKELVESNRGGPRGAAHYSPPWDNGFDTCFSTEAKVPTWDPMLRPKAAKGNTWWEPAIDAGDARPYGTHYWTNGHRVKENLRGDDSRVIMDRAIPFIRGAAEEDEPFLAVIWFHTPHLPVVAGPQYTRMYEKHDHHRRHYYGCITAMDEQIGRLREELTRLGIDKNTLIAFCSDNGPEGGGSAPGSTGGLRGRKRSLFEGGVRVPGVIVWPARIQPGSTTDVPACTSDYLPTIVELLGAKRLDKRPLDGVSLLELFDGKMSRRPRPIGFQSRGQLSLVDNRWKIIRSGGGKRQGKRNKDAADGFMLFDLVADRGEQMDVAKQHPEVVKEMAATVAAWQQSCRDSLDGKDYPAAPDG